MAAQLYLAADEAGRREKFSTYYTWFMAEAINNYDPITETVNAESLSRFIDVPKMKVVRFPRDQRANS